jgi:hypothetical protein
MRIDVPRWYDSFQKMFGERDGRLHHRKIGEVFGATDHVKSQLFEPVFCYCGKAGGYATKGTPIIYVCQPCTSTYGHLPLPMVPGTEEV